MEEITVLGTGHMGRQIALAFLNAGCKVRLVKMSSADDDIALKQRENELDNYFKKRLFLQELFSNLTYQLWIDYLKYKDSSDLVIESIVEDFSIKKQIFHQLEPILQDKTILSTNTSNLSINKLSEDLPSHLQERFIGLHFFTPVRHMKLVEIIPSKNFNQVFLPSLKDFIHYSLGKNVVVANDVVGFVANRIGFYSNHEVMGRAEKEGLSVADTDRLSGKWIGRSKMGPYRLSDLTGIHLSHRAVDLYQKDKETRNYFQKRPISQYMIDQNLIGNSVNQGYYKTIDNEEFMLDIASKTYIPYQETKFKFLQQLNSNNLEANLKAIFNSKDPIAQFMWTSIQNTLYFAALNVPFATNNYKAIDQALVNGYNWQAGPFEIWDMVGFEPVKSRIKKEIGPLPKWINQRKEAFYRSNEKKNKVSSYHLGQAKSLFHKENLGNLYLIENTILVFEIATQHSTINNELLKCLTSIIQDLNEKPYHGLVIASKGKNFSVGYDLNIMLANFKSGLVTEYFQESLSLGQALTKAIKESNKPIISAIKGFALGGGAEIALQSDEIVCATETKFGLVEFQVGIIPGGGGLVEYSEQILSSNISRYEKKQNMLEKFMLFALAQKSNNGYHAIQMGYLPSDQTTVVPHKDLIVDAAIDRIKFLKRYQNPLKAPKEFEALGTDFIASITGLANNWYEGRFIDDYQRDLLIHAGRLLAGGEVPMGTLINRDHLQQVEIEIFHHLIKDSRAEQMIENTLKVGN